LNADRLSALVFLAIGLCALYSSTILGLGTTREPGPGFLGFLTSSFISLMALIVFFQSIKKIEDKKQKVSDLWRGLKWRRPLGVCLITIGYILVFEWLGFVVSTFLFLMILMKGMEALAWWKALFLSALSTGFSYLLLSISLESTLPKGIFGF
jgi:putative tricarboxylic transport membrane protein